MNNKKIKFIAEISIFSAIIIILQLVATFINFGSFPITLTLIPIIVGACVYGPFIGMFLGLVFGIIVDIMVITGADINGAAMFSARPIVTIVMCLLKGMLAGLFSGLAYKYIKIENRKIKTIVSSAICPIVNTLIFSIALILFFDNSFKILIGAFLSINFVIELLINILLAPGLTNLIEHSKNRIHE